MKLLLFITAVIFTACTSQKARIVNEQMRLKDSLVKYEAMWDSSARSFAKSDKVYLDKSELRKDLIAHLAIDYVFVAVIDSFKKRYEHLEMELKKY